MTTGGYTATQAQQQLYAQQLATNTTTNTTDWFSMPSIQLGTQIGMGLQGVANAIKKICFMRVNEKADMPEGGTYADPLDELRLKVKRWLKTPEMEHGA